MTAIEFPTPDPRTFDETSRPFAEAIAGQYAIRKMIGRGGMGVVYLARDRRLDRLVAIKTLAPQVAADPAVRERFLRETRAAGGMSHPNIVPVHGADEIDGHVFFVMGYVDGESLASHIAAHARLEARTVIRIMRDVAAALSHAHRRGIIHRDIKAENILIERATGSALVTDFGIARLAEAAPLTATGQLLGTVYYVSPEQVSGDRIDQRSDLYSLGVVGYLALTGRFPFDGDLASAILVAHVTRPAPSVRSVNPDAPAALSAIVERCLVKDPAERFASADEVLSALDAAQLEIEQSPVGRARGSRVSDTEAHAIWQRAADLQAMTGIRTRPAPVASVRDTARDHARTSGFSVTEVRNAAAEAGISADYVEHALVERGLLGGQITKTSNPPPRSATRRSLLAGVPLDIVFDAEIDGELDSRRFDRLINTLREGTGTLGTVASSQRHLEWRSGWFGHRIEAIVWSDDARTKIRLRQSLRRSAFGILTGSVAGGAAIGTAVGGALAAVMLLPAPAWSFRLMDGSVGAIATAVGIAVGLVSIRLGRGWISRIRDYNAARLQTLRDLLSFRADPEAPDR